VTAAATGTWHHGAASFRGEVDLDIDAGSHAAHALATQLAAQQAAVEHTGSGHTRLTLHLRADTVEQAALWLLGLVLPLNRQVLRLHVTDAAGETRG
jgi:hypothetical protein